MITAHDVLDAIIAAEEEKHESQQGYIEERNGLSEVVVNCNLNLARVAELLNEKPAKAAIEEYQKQ